MEKTTKTDDGKLEVIFESKVIFSKEDLLIQLEGIDREQTLLDEKRELINSRLKQLQ
jgi:hypothetical protein